jgi:hypothetical protein
MLTASSASVLFVNFAPLSVTVDPSSKACVLTAVIIAMKSQRVGCVTKQHLCFVLYKQGGMCGSFDFELYYLNKPFAFIIFLLFLVSVSYVDLYL